MKIFCDYHFHPNFKFRLNMRRQAEQIIAQFEKYEFDVVVVSEHVWKRPSDSFAYLDEQRKLLGSNLIFVPGVEILSSEGLDVLIFSNNPYFYQIKTLHDLFVPYLLDLETIIKIIIQRDDLKGFFPHPFTRGTSGLVKNFGESMTLEMIQKLGAVEVSNNSYWDLLNLINSKKLKKIAPKFIGGIEFTQNLDNELINKLNLDFVAHGSDAHNFKEIGFGCFVDFDDSKKLNLENSFKALAKNRNISGINKNKNSKPKSLIRCAHSAFTSSQEFIQKKNERKDLKLPSQKKMRKKMLADFQKKNK